MGENHLKPIMVYDFETNGLPIFNQPSDDPQQPHIVQAACVLVDGVSRQELASIDLIAKPDGWTIPDDVAAIHGITTDRAAQLGVAEIDIVAIIWGLWSRCSIRLAHNETFDARMMRIALKRYADRLGPDWDPDQWKAGQAACTAILSQPILKLPATAAMHATGRHGSKKPKLTEAYKFFFGKEMENAHTAMGDVRGCLSVYWAIQDWGSARAGEEAAIQEGGSEMPFLS